MLRLCCKFAASIILVSGLLTLSARTIGAAQSPNSALEAFKVGCENIAQPCWFGIVPGVTDFQTAQLMLSNNDFQVSFYGYPNFLRFSGTGDNPCSVFMTFAEKVVDKIQFWDCGHFELGEVQSILGKITSIQFDGTWNYEFVEGKISIVPTENQTLPQILKPSLPISQIIIQSSTDGEDNRQIIFWHGYMHLLSYCKRQLEIAACQ